MYLRPQGRTRVDWHMIATSAGGYDRGRLFEASVWFRGMKTTFLSFFGERGVSLWAGRRVEAGAGGMDDDDVDALSHRPT